MSSPGALCHSEPGNILNFITRPLALGNANGCLTIPNSSPIKREPPNSFARTRPRPRRALTFPQSKSFTIQSIVRTSSSCRLLQFTPFHSLIILYTVTHFILLHSLHSEHSFVLCPSRSGKKKQAKKKGKTTPIVSPQRPLSHHQPSYRSEPTGHLSSWFLNLRLRIASRCWSVMLKLKMRSSTRGTMIPMSYLSQPKPRARRKPQQGRSS